MALVLRTTVSAKSVSRSDFQFKRLIPPATVILKKLSVRDVFFIVLYTNFFEGEKIANDDKIIAEVRIQIRANLFFICLIY